MSANPLDDRNERQDRDKARALVEVALEAVRKAQVLMAPWDDLTWCRLWETSQNLNHLTDVL